MTSLADRYDRIAQRYERWWAPVLAPTARGLLELPDLANLVRGRPDARILDIGTGSGTLATAIVERWPAVRVAAIDASAGMLDVAREMAKRRVGVGALSRLRLKRANADELPFADQTFDAVVSSFVFQLVPNRYAAFREARRVLMPGGLLAILTWLGQEAIFEPDEALEEALDELELDFDDEPEERRSGNFPSAKAAAAQAQRSGFAAVRTVPAELVHHYDPDTYLEFLEQYAERGLFEGLERDERNRLRTATRRRLERLDPNEFVWRMRVLTVVGRRPDARRAPNSAP